MAGFGAQGYAVVLIHSLARAQCVPKEHRSRETDRAQKGRILSRPFSTPHLTDPTIAVFLNLSMAAAPIATNFWLILDARRGQAGAVSDHPARENGSTGRV